MAPRPLYLWSDGGELMGLAWRCRDQRRKILLRIQDPAAQTIGQGLVTRTQAPPPRDALVVFDATGRHRDGAVLRRQKHLIIGGNALEPKLETDRVRAAGIFAGLGLALPETHGCRTLADAIRFLERVPDGDRFFVKFSGDHETQLTKTARTAAMLVRKLRWLERTRHDLRQGIEIQRAIEGCEVSCEGFFSAGRFVPPFNFTLEDKHFMAGDVGQRIGCAWNAVGFLPGDLPLLAQVGVAKLAPILGDYCGAIDLNGILAPDGVLYILEATARIGWDAFPAYANLFDETFVDQLEAFAEGTLDRWEPIDEGALSLTVRVSVPPYPQDFGVAEVLRKRRGAPLDPALLDDPDAWLVDVMRGPDGPAFAGAHGWIACLGAVGSDPVALRRQVVARARALDIDDLEYRVDPGRGMQKRLDALAAAGAFGDDRARQGQEASAA